MMFLPMDVILSRHDVVEPDLLYFSYEREQTFVPSDWVAGAPNLVMEVASPSTKRRDETIKRHLYERFGVDESWLVDPDAETVVGLRLHNGVYVEAARLRAVADDVLTTPWLPDFDVSLRTLCAH
ncbi:MAG: Uma2 family endonuclease [Vicinamibacterales bacterium]